MTTRTITKGVEGLWRKALSYHYDKAVGLSLVIVENKARAILQQHSNLDEFIMCMGGWFFTSKRKDTRGQAIIIDPYDDIHRCPKYMTGLRRFIDEWDDYLKITGESVRFTANGEKITDW